MASTSSSAAPAATSQSGSNLPNLPVSVKALTGVLVVLALIVSGFVAWWVRSRLYKRRERRAAANGDYNEKRSSTSSTGTTGKESLFGYSDVETGLRAPHRVLLVPPPPPSPTSGAAWVPQTKPWTNPVGRQIQIQKPAPAIRGQTKAPQNLEKSEKNEKSFGYAAAEPSPPPMYAPADNGSQRSLPLPPPAPQAQLPAPPPAHPPTALKLSLPILPTASDDVASPRRTASFCPSPATTKPPAKDKKLPRLMLVAQTFVPSLEDELPIALDETVRLVEEYEDGWCLVARVGGAVEQGVIPRFCLAERQGVVPKQKTFSVSVKGNKRK